MKPRPSSYDIARRAGVSQTTVSFVLNHRMDKPISTATRERVLRAAHELGYRHNSLARSLIRGTTQTVGLIVPRLDSLFCARIAQGVQDACEEQDYRVLMAHTRHRAEVEARQVNFLLEHRVDGLICVNDEWTVQRMTEWLDDVIAQGVPCVLVDDATFGDRVDCVVSDDQNGGRVATEHLLAMGHRRIAHLRAGTDVRSARDRASGYAAALAEAGLPPDAYLVAGSSFEIEDWRPAIRSLLSGANPPTAIFAANDYVAATVCRMAREFGLLVPDDIAVVGYGDLEVARFLDLSTVNQDPVRLGRVAVERLLKRLADPTLPPETITLPTHLVARGSSVGRVRAITPESPP